MVQKCLPISKQLFRKNDETATHWQTEVSFCSSYHTTGLLIREISKNKMTTTDLIQNSCHTVTCKDNNYHLVCKQSTGIIRGNWETS